MTLLEGQPQAATSSRFEVHLDNFTGPFDLLLSLVAKRKLDVTEIALAEVTDEFIAHIRAAEEAAAAAHRAGLPHEAWDLAQASEFLVVAATLLDLKAARLLPAGVVDDEEDLRLLEARDLLFARLLQYRAFKQVAQEFAVAMEAEARSVPRDVSLEPALVAVLPELVWTLDPEAIADLARQALAPKPEPPGVPLEHLHSPVVSVRDQARILADRLRAAGEITFREMVEDAQIPAVVVARFLALLEMFRDGLIGFEQLTPLGELVVRWTAKDA